MSLSFKSNTTSKVDLGRVPDDSYTARIVQVIDLGLQHETYWKNGEPLFYRTDGEGFATADEGGDGNPVIKHKVWITFEFLTEFVEIDGEKRPRWYSKEYVVSTHEKASMTKLIAATGAKINRLDDLLGHAVLVEIGSTTSGKAKVVAVSKVPKLLGEQPPLINEAVSFDIDKPNMEVYDGLPQFLKDKITESTNFSKSALFTKLTEGNSAHVSNAKAESTTSFEDDVPF